MSRKTARALSDERYAPSAWWTTSPPDCPRATLTDDWDVCAGCRRWVLLDVPCPWCAADRAARQDQTA